MGMSLLCVNPQTHDGSGRSTLEKGGRDPPTVSFDQILEDLTQYCSKFTVLRQAKHQIEEKYDVQKEVDGCWSDDDLKRAWGKTQRMDENSSRRKHWTVVIMLQMLRRPGRPDSMTMGRDLSRLCEALSLRDMSEQMQVKQAAGGAEQISTANPSMGQTYSASQSSGVSMAGTTYIGKTPERTQVTGSAGSNSASQSSVISTTETNYIRIPLSVMTFINRETTKEVQSERSPFKLIDGFPSQTHIQRKRSYAMSFDQSRMNARWVYEILNKETLPEPEPNLEIGSFGNYDRGHLAAAANHRWCLEAYNDTFLFSNIVPQNHRLNSSVWKTLEHEWRKNAKKKNIRNVHVYSGPVYKGNNLETIQGKAVPSHLFKVVIEEHIDGTVKPPKCYLMANEAPQRTSTVDYITDIRDIQVLTELTFIEQRTEPLGDFEICVPWLGEDGNGVAQAANTKVKISLPLDSPTQ